VSTTVVFETHALTVDNERGMATGWLPGKLSAAGWENARALGERRRNDGVAAVFTSDLGRAVETAMLAFAGTGIPVLHDWRLRECDYGEWNGAPVTQVHDARVDHLDTPYPVVRVGATRSRASRVSSLTSRCVGIVHASS
jgi:2,3-bisphosphoglycerate-dependent phosphoglycerate mutase